MYRFRKKHARLRERGTGEGGGGSQFQRRDRHCGTLGIYQNQIKMSVPTLELGPPHPHMYSTWYFVRFSLDQVSVADPGCLSPIPDPDFYTSRILIFTHPGSRISDPDQKPQQKRGVKKICCHAFFCSYKFHNICNYFIFGSLKKKIWANFQRIIESLPKNLSLSSEKYGFEIRDLGSEIRDPEKTYSGTRIQGSKRHRIPDPHHWIRYLRLMDPRSL